MTKKRGILILIIIVTCVFGMKLFSDNVYFENTSEYSQTAFYQHFNLKPVSKDSKLEEYFEHKKYNNPYVFLFQHSPTYEQRYHYKVADNENYSVVLTACDSNNGYDINKDSNDVMHTYPLTIRDKDIELSVMQSNLNDYPVYNYRMSFTNKNKYYTIMVYGIEDKKFNTTSTLTDDMKNKLTSIVNEIFV